MQGFIKYLTYMKINITENGQPTGALYEKPDGTFTTWSQSDIIAVNLTVILVGGALLGFLSSCA